MMRKLPRMPCVCSLPFRATGSPGHYTISYGINIYGVIFVDRTLTLDPLCSFSRSRQYGLMYSLVLTHSLPGHG